MARLLGRAPKTEPLCAAVLDRHGNTTTFVVALTDGDDGGDSPINRDAFQASVDQVLVRELRPGDIVIMHNLSSHKGVAIHQAVEATGASLLFLPTYSPDFNLIETACAKFNAPA